MPFKFFKTMVWSAEPGTADENIEKDVDMGLRLIWSANRTGVFTAAHKITSSFYHKLNHIPNVCDPPKKLCHIEYCIHDHSSPSD